VPPRKKPKGPTKPRVPREPIEVKHAPLIAALAVCGNIKEAAASAGISYSRARQLLSEHPSITEAVTAARSSLVENTLTEWSEYLAEAQRTLVARMRSEDEDVSLKATIHLLDRIEGKPTQKVEAKVEHQEQVADSAQMRLALGLVLTRKIGLAEALEWVQKNPESVSKWAESQDHTPERVPTDELREST
jgi:molybdenum-dependent DNA-binding transcriptional regulator ModE